MIKSTALLQRAEKRAWVDPQSEREPARTYPRPTPVRRCARHRVKCKATERVKPRADVGEALLGLAKDYGADLLARGCCRHTRPHECVLGGASRHAPANKPLAVLMSH